MEYPKKKKTSKKIGPAKKTLSARIRSASNFIGRTPPRKKQIDAQLKKMGQ